MNTPATVPLLLVVDDDADDRAMTLRVLRKSGLALRCVEAENGEAALEFLRSSNELPVLTLMDLKMPGVNGIEALRRIRADARTRHLPVVILTNSVLAADDAAARAAGADDFLHKAIDLRRYASDISALLARWVQ